MFHNYPYLKDTVFLKEFDKIKLKEKLLKIIALDKHENPIKQLTGKVINGSISVNGDSAMRRTGNLTFAINENQTDIMNIDNLLSINKRVAIEIGFKNTTKHYLKYPILWFPQGVFIISAPSIDKGSSGIEVSLTLHDKMALLNGEAGGTLPAPINFHEMEDEDNFGNITITKPTIKTIIQELVNHWGGQQLGKIIINNLEDRVKKVMRWTGDKDSKLYIYSDKIALNQDEIMIQILENCLPNLNQLLNKKGINYIKISKIQLINSFLSNYPIKINKIIEYIKNIENYLQKIKEHEEKQTSLIDTLESLKETYISTLDQQYYFPNLEEYKILQKNENIENHKDLKMALDDLTYYKKSFQELYTYIKNKYDNGREPLLLLKKYFQLIKSKETSKAREAFEQLKFNKSFSVDYAPLINLQYFLKEEYPFLDQGNTSFEKIEKEIFNTLKGSDFVFLGYATFSKTGSLLETFFNNLIQKIEKYKTNLDKIQYFEKQLSILEKENNYFYLKAKLYLDELYQEIQEMDNEIRLSNTQRSTNINNLKNTIEEALNSLQNIFNTEFKKLERQTISQKIYDFKKDFEEIQNKLKEANKDILTFSNEFGEKASNEDITKEELVSEINSRIEILRDIQLHYRNKIISILSGGVNSISNYLLYKFQNLINSKIIAAENISKQTKEQDKKKIKEFSIATFKKSVSIFSQNIQNIQVFEYGDDIGYILDDFSYPGELIGQAGETVTSILDKIKQTLGNYEYYYDINGNFIFQEIKNYINTSYSTSILQDLSSEKYNVDYASGKNIYNFSNSEIIQSFSNAPNYNNIKNDFVVWGQRSTVEGKKIPIRYHLAIDDKPIVQTKFFFDIINNPFQIDGNYEFKTSLPKEGKRNVIYFTTKENKYYRWNFSKRQYQNLVNNNYQNFPSYSIKIIDGIKYDMKIKNGLEYVVDKEKNKQFLMSCFSSQDFRTELYLQGKIKESQGLTSNDYYTELSNEWAKLYSIRHKRFWPQVAKNPSAIDYFLDIIDTKKINQLYGVQNIGRRTKIIKNSKINCIFQPQCPDNLYINNADENKQILKKQAEDWNKKNLSNFSIFEIPEQIYNKLTIGGYMRSAYEEIRTVLYQYTTYNQQISLTIVPIYYLEPNSRISVNDTASGISGDYMVKSFSIPLGAEQNMTLSCSKALESI